MNSSDTHGPNRRSILRGAAASLITFAFYAAGTTGAEASEPTPTGLAQERPPVAGYQTIIGLL